VTWGLQDRRQPLTPTERDLVMETLDLWHQDRYRLAGYVIMDDHVHLMVFPLPPHSLASILHSWKSFTAKAINRLRGETGTRWQKNNYTQVIRNETELRAKLEYIMDNPRRRWPEETNYKWVKFFDVL
jgi:putative DNA methylase